MRVPSFRKLEMLCAKFGWNWPSDSGEEYENVKSLRLQRQQWERRITDKFWSEKLTWNCNSPKTVLNQQESYRLTWTVTLFFFKDCIDFHQNLHPVGVGTYISQFMT